MTSDQIRVVGEVISRLGRGFSGVVARARHDIFITLAWGLITWGVFQLNPRAWAISVGIYLATQAILAAFAGGKKDV
jgi:hypothetical protein